MRKTAVVALVLLTASAGAADWPQWRGPARDGRATVAPTLLDRRGTVPLALVAVLLLALAAMGLLVTWLAATFVRRLPLLPSLHSE